MRKLTAISLVAVLVLGVGATGTADVPQLLNYQGVLASGGVPVSTPVDAVFSIWNDPVSGDSLWSEQQVVTPDSLGRFNVLLGSVSPIPDTAFSGINAFMSVSVEGHPEMAPRQRLVSVGYAYKAESADYAQEAGNADLLDGYDATHFAAAGQTNVFRCYGETSTTTEICPATTSLREITSIVASGNGGVEIRIGGVAIMYFDFDANGTTTWYRNNGAGILVQPSESVELYVPTGNSQVTVMGFEY